MCTNKDCKSTLESDNFLLTFQVTKPPVVPPGPPGRAVLPPAKPPVSDIVTLLPF